MVGAERKKKKLGPLDRRKQPFQTFICSYSYKTLGQNGKLALLELNFLRSVRRNVWKFIQ
jgi:hypothetical protein